ncbi:MAG: hypothetical protein K0S12_2416 [Bacteroidetes bacterium]|nr:hypothetical protein [Bacteroidota bacterium]
MELSPSPHNIEHMNRNANLKRGGLRKYFFLLMLTLGLSAANSQTLTLDELLAYPNTSQDTIDSKLKAKGWETHNVEFVTDSNLVRRSWIIANKYNDLKSYLQLYDFTKDSEENNISYQFSDRKTYESYGEQLKKMGFKELTSKKKKKKKKEDKNLYKEKEQLYYSEKRNSLVSLKEIFVYGMNAFVIYSYKASSRTAKDLMQREN